MPKWQKWVDNEEDNEIIDKIPKKKKPVDFEKETNKKEKPRQKQDNIQ
jgi:hypothetical protein